MRIISLVFPSNVTMIWSGMGGMSLSHEGDDEDVGDVGVECESGDGDRDAEFILQRCV